jgi:hypothetical protein
MRKFKSVTYCTATHGWHVGHVFDYLLENSENLFLFLHPLGSKNGMTAMRHYRNGELIREEFSFRYRGNSKILIYSCVFLNFWHFMYRFGIRDSDILATHPIFLF